MGIRNLTSSLRPYASNCILDEAKVVIDGPAMAFHIFNLWSQKNQCVRSILDLPTCQWIGDATVAWLDQLQHHNITVAKIYFDAYLPPSKQPVRIERLAKDTITWTTYYWAYSNGVPPSSKQHSDKIQPLSRRSDPVTRRPANMPSPTLFVASVIETLLALPRYAPLVELVPNEADGYCAAFAASSSGDCTIVTSDSDLLVYYPLGRHSSVVFLQDVYQSIIQTKSRITALRFCPVEIAERLGISEHGGICRLAHEMSRLAHSTLRQHLQRIQKEAPSPSYAEFRNEYQILNLGEPTCFPANVVRNLNLLDPRVSEFFLRCTIPGSLTGDYSPHLVPMYLPGLLDCPVRASAWNGSESVRRLAYGLAAAPFNTGRTTVVEYRRVQASHSGTPIDIPTGLSLSNIAEALLTVLTALAAHITTDNTTVTNHIWNMFCVYSDCRMALSRDIVPCSCALLRKIAASGASPPDVTSWDLLHFAAQHKATHYSLRFLKQVLDILSASDYELTNPCQDLRVHLEELLPLRSLPSPAQLADCMSKWNTTDVFSCMSKVLGAHDIFTIASQEDTPRSALDTGDKKKKKKKKKQKKKSQKSKTPALSTSLSGNPFGALDRKSAL